MGLGNGVEDKGMDGDGELVWLQVWAGTNWRKKTGTVQCLTV